MSVTKHTFVVTQVVVDCVLVADHFLRGLLLSNDRASYFYNLSFLQCRDIVCGDQLLYSLVMGLKRFLSKGRQIAVAATGMSW